jgi:4-amino-4-deoxy-L-arabinose transferase-like glycosyltransferase
MKGRAKGREGPSRSKQGRGAGEKEDGKGLTFRRFLYAIIVLGIVLRILTFWSGYMYWDSAYYIQMGRSFSEGGNFILPWGDPFSSAHTGHVPEPSHHFSPLFPMYLGSIYAVLGFSLGLTRLLAILMSLLLLLVIQKTSKDLVGGDKALIMTAVFSVQPCLLMTTRDLMPENIIVMLFVLTIWAIIKAIKDDRYMVLAAIFAAASYLTKSSVGYLFIIAGVGGFAWRFLYIRWEVFKRKYYLMAIVLFLGIVAAWALRNIRTFGWPNWSTSPYLDQALVEGFRSPLGFFGTLVVTVPFFLAISLTFGSYWLPWIRRSLSGIKRERTSAMWLAVLLTFVISLWFSVALANFEGSDEWTHSLDRIRYLVIAFPPMMWAIMDEVKLPSLDARVRVRSLWNMVNEADRNLRRDRTKGYRFAVLAFLIMFGIFPYITDPEYLSVSLMVMGGAVAFLMRGDPRKVLTVMLAVFTVIAVEAGTATVVTPEMTMSNDLNDMVGPGQTVAIDGSNINSGYMYMGIDHFDFDLVMYEGGTTPDFIISYDLAAAYPNYTLVKVYAYEHTPGAVKGLAYVALGREFRTTEDTIALWRWDG